VNKASPGRGIRAGGDGEFQSIDFGSIATILPASADRWGQSAEPEGYLSKGVSKAAQGCSPRMCQRCQHAGHAYVTTLAKTTLGANRLFWGDNLDSLRRDIRDETVDLCYIDPPFNSKRTYHQIYNHKLESQDLAQEQAFVDSWTWDDRAREGYQEIISNGTGGYTVQTIELIKGFRNVIGEGNLLAYLVSMTRRIVEIHRVLKSTGSFYLHCDPTSSHYLKLVLDGIFCGRDGDFKNEIVWQRSTAHNDTAQGLKKLGRIHDVLLFYTKTDQWTWNPQFTAYNDEYLEVRFKNSDRRGKYKDADLTAAKPGGDTSYAWRVKRQNGGQWTHDLSDEWKASKEGVEYKASKPSVGRFWAYSRENMIAFAREDRLHYFASGMPRLKQHVTEMPGVGLQDVWTDIPPINSQAQERLGYPTQKPEALLERIIQLSSNAGDLVLDAYCGCGTSVAVAQRLGRQWIGMDITYQAIAVILKRLEDTFPGQHVAEDVIMDGIPRDVASAQALANKNDDRVRKEFEKWAVLTYTRNRAVINYKRGADGGVDGTAYFYTSPSETDKVVFQAKSGGVERKDIAALKGDMEREKAAIGILITLEEPTQPMKAEAKRAGLYTHAFTGANYDRVQIVTIQEIIEQDKRFTMPMSVEVLKAAKAVEEVAHQPELPILRPVMTPAAIPTKEKRRAVMAKAAGKQPKAKSHRTKAS
jgi:DNA modification methylase